MERAIGPCLRRGDEIRWLHSIIKPSPLRRQGPIALSLHAAPAYFAPAPFGTTAIVQSFSGFRYFAAVACNSAGVIVVKSLTSV